MGEAELVISSAIKDIKNNLNQDRNSKILLLYHQNHNDETELIRWKDNDLKNRLKCFSPYSLGGGSCSFKEDIESLMKAFCSEVSQNRVTSIIDNCKVLWNKLVTSNDIHFLRSQILYPFVTLHLALQAYFEKVNKVIFDNACKDCCEKIKGFDTSEEPLSEFLEKYARNDKGNIEMKFGELKKIIVGENGKGGLYSRIENNEQLNDDFKKLYEDKNKGLIGDFADILENVVEEIESNN